MTLNQPIAVDFSQEAATSKVLKRPNLLSSHQVKWHGIYLEYHQHPPHETPEHYPKQHVLAIQTLGKVEAERRLDGRLKQEQINVGDVCVVPAHTSHWIHSNGEQELILLSLEPSFLKHIAYESIASKIELIPHFAKPDPLIHQIGLSLKAALQTDPLGSRFYADSLITALAAHLLQFYTDRKPIVNADVGSNSQIGQAIEYIHEHLNEDLSLEAIASLVGMSKFHFCRLFKQTTGLTPWQYVIKLRIEAAKRLLSMPKLSIAQISLQMGYSTQGQFANFFRKHTGVSPSTYRRHL
ncbi:AraC family transcriptional regulator [Calothrix parasitica NIES-267]|uniref:AraC family transcriptional regulator n=1 Tax=Calothrix parasitica NIES-267 TaxID=1973488 RepID=A0A1Z4LN33_9CYAN|nr:AraC family transcriptional regulator [Calothrix parasitica NIES-267]